LNKEGTQSVSCLQHISSPLSQPCLI